MTPIDIEDEPPLELADADRAVLNARIRDARTSVRDIATETGIVANRVDDRLTRLENAGVIRGYTARVDYDALGYDVTAILRLSTTDDAVLDRLREDPQFIAVYAVTGRDDVVAVGKFHGTDQLNSAATELLTADDVQTVDASVALDVVREFEPFELDAE
ncbi:Lrp/AsnC family transcriptional regulator [Halapricum salinum]|uniref:Lrp/AsnC family transcriptional regulator n=1 Tax=Halapricum salinum TaxID=1457250 RepID=A0A4D6HAN1_9EURY|nr:Lrp/AsnC family transcriptional regulator [Halapricum salinum]QCC51053.1 Lrp/AsnC family transcriptional regulator [Halapricum salinum]